MRELRIPTNLTGLSVLTVDLVLITGDDRICRA